MRTVGQVLKEEREKKFYTLEEIEKATKIRLELLQALEMGWYDKLPPPTFVQGFIKNYGQFLKLDTQKLLAIYRREFSDQKNPPKILESLKSPAHKKGFHLTPTRVVVSVVLSLVITFFVYLWLEYRFLVGAPFLEVNYPPDQISLDQSTLKVEGETDPEAQVSINNQPIEVQVSGKFSQEIKLTESANTIVITALSKSGQITKIERTVFLRQ